MQEGDFLKPLSKSRRKGNSNREEEEQGNYSVTKMDINIFGGSSA